MLEKPWLYSLLWAFYSAQELQTPVAASVIATALGSIGTFSITNKKKTVTSAILFRFWQNSFAKTRQFWKQFRTEWLFLACFTEIGIGIDEFRPIKKYLVRSILVNIISTK